MLVSGNRMVVVRAALGVLGLLTAGPMAVGQVVSELVAPGVVRFFASPGAQADSEASVALGSAVSVIGVKPAGFPIEPVFEDRFGESFVGIDVDAGTDLYGTGMVSGPLERTGRQARLYNFDAFGYGDQSETLYQSHPWVLGVRADGSAFGVLADTTWRARVDLSGMSGFDIGVFSEGPVFAVYVIEKGSPRAVLGALRELTGAMPMPPLWALGYHQCRYSYYPASRVMEVAQEFRDREIPADVIWMDIDYMDGFRVFTFDPAGFPDPAQLNADLEAIDFRNVWMINPGVKLEPGYGVYDSGQAEDVWVNQASFTSSDLTGVVWPGTVKLPDFLKASVRDWWADLYVPWMAEGIDGVWNDMNEPTLFDGGADRTAPDDAWHRADAALGGPGPHVRYHNVYGMQMVRATREGVSRANPDRRPFVLSRANYLGGHRYAATWSGDNVANEYHLDVSIPMVLNLGLSGQPFSGPDIGGFIGDGGGDLFARWMGVGSMLPFARGHTGKNERDKEPWAFGPEVERVSRLALQRRYRLMRHFYTAFWQAHTEGVPVARPLFFADPSDAALRTEDDVFLVGDGLVVSIAGGGSFACGTQDVTFPAPEGGLYKFGFAVSDADGAASDIDEAQLPDLFLRGGSIVPAGPIIQHTGELAGTDLTLIVALDENGEASGVLYEDAGDGYGFEQGEYLLTGYEAFTAGDVVTVRVASEEGSFARPARDVTVRLLLGNGEEVRATGVDGEDVQLVLPAGRDAMVSRSGAVDGCSIPSDFLGAGAGGQVVATQRTPTLAGDNENELNRLFVRFDGDRMGVGLTGNLGDFRAVALFVDSIPGGQGVLDLSTQTPPPLPLPPLNGLAFDDGFEPDRLYLLNTNDQGQFWIDEVSLPTGAPGVKVFRGTSFEEAGDGLLEFGDNPLGMLAAVSNFNTGGVTATSASGAAGATSGIEMEIPLGYLGLSQADGCTAVKVAAVIVGFDGAVTNQMLPSLPGGASDFGVAPDLALVSGTQFGVYGPAGDVDGDGASGLSDLLIVLNGFGVAEGAERPDGDLTGDGAVGLDDLLEMLSVFGSCGG